MAGMKPYTEEQALMVLYSRSFDAGEHKRNQALFVVQLCLGPRINEELRLTIGDVVDQWGRLRDRVTFRHTKNGKNRTVKVLNELIYRFLPPWLERLAVLGYTLGSDPLFPGQGRAAAVSDRQVRYIYQAANEEIGLTDGYSTHSCRKTWACQTYDWLCAELRRGANIDPLSELAILGGWETVEAARRYIADHISRAAACQQAIFPKIRANLEQSGENFR